MSRTVRLALVQMSDAGSPQKCVDKALQMAGSACDQGANLICLQELFNGPYPCQAEDHRNFDYAEPLDGPTVERVREFAQQRSAVVVAPVFERRAPGLYHNSVVVVDVDGSIAGVYRKMHIPDDPLFYEKFYFTPGDQNPGFQPIQTSVAKIGVGICWDQWFPEAARLLALSGAEILLYPTAIGWIDEEKEEFGQGQRDAWLTVVRSHAITNGLFLGAPNRVGVEGRLQFWGSSFISSPSGQVLGQLDTETENILLADCQLADIDAVRTHWPFLRDRRIDAYQNLTRRYIDDAVSGADQATGGKSCG